MAAAHTSALRTSLSSPKPPFANNVNQPSTKEMFRSVTYLTEWLIPSVKTSKPKPATPFGVAFDTDNFYEFMERPENAYRLTQFTRSMSGARATQGEKTIATQSGVYYIHQTDDWRGLT